MPNHFHFLIRANSFSTRIVKEGTIKINALTEGIRMLLSSYTKAIQKQESLTGNLFQQKTKFKCVDDYLGLPFITFIKIHLEQNLSNILKIGNGLLCLNILDNHKIQFAIRKLFTSMLILIKIPY